MYDHNNNIFKRFYANCKFPCNCNLPIFVTVQLYNLRKIKKILISGESSNVIGKSVPKAKKLKEVFIYCGIPEKDIILEDKSRSTVESAYYSKSLIDSLNIDSEFLLVTSAFYIPSSMGCFASGGISVKAYPVDYYSQDEILTLDYILLPSDGTFLIGLSLFMK